MKNLLVIGLMLVVVMPLAACGGQALQQAGQTFKVTRGDLAVTVSGSGSIEMSHALNLTFGTAGRIESLLVKEGDQVKEGDVIARLEMDALALSLTQSEVTYAQTQLTVNQYGLAVNQAAAAVTQAEIAVKSAEIALEQTTRSSSVTDIRVAQAEVETAKRNLDDSLFTLTLYASGSVGYNEYQKNVVLAQARYKAAQDRLDAMLSGFSTNEVLLKQQQITAAQQSLTNARQSLDIAMVTAELGKQSLLAAGQSRDYARKQLDRAILLSPFAGTIASVPVDQGDTVLATTVIARVVDVGLMRLDVQVDEIDIPGVKPGQRVTIKVDALPDTLFNGKVDYIGLLPKKESGVTLFNVRIILEPTKEESGLRGGMSASAEIVTAERTGTLLVPGRVIRTDRDGKTTVQVSAGGQLAEREVVTGISDALQTEILSGLQEGETVVQDKSQ